MSTHDNAPPPADWSPEPRPCVVLDFLAARLSRDEELPPNIVLGTE